MTTTKQERYESYLHVPGTKMAMCCNCAHYYPHYDEDGRNFSCGHCVRPRMKLRHAYDICEHFEGKPIRKRGVEIVRRERR